MQLLFSFQGPQETRYTGFLQSKCPQADISLPIHAVLWAALLGRFFPCTLKGVSVAIDCCVLRLLADGRFSLRNLALSTASLSGSGGLKRRVTRRFHGLYCRVSRAPLRLVPPLLPFREVVGSSGLEPPTSRLSGVRSNHLSYEPFYGGDEEVRTPDPLLAKQVLSQLSYTPALYSKSLLAFESLFRPSKLNNTSSAQIPSPEIFPYSG